MPDKKPRYLTIHGVLDALGHLASYASEGGEDSNSAIFHLWIFLYKNPATKVKEKILKFI